MKQSKAGVQYTEVSGLCPMKASHVRVEAS